MQFIDIFIHILSHIERGERDIHIYTYTRAQGQEQVIRDRSNHKTYTQVNKRVKMKTNKKAHLRRYAITVNIEQLLLASIIALKRTIGIENYHTLRLFATTF